MQPTANLWDVLCRDLEVERSQSSHEQQSVAAQHFKETAERVFQESSPRRCDALEIAGDVCQAAGSLHEAEENFEGALSQNLKIGRVSAAARVAAKLALLQDHLGKETEALLQYTKALRLYGDCRDHSQDILLACNLAALQKRTGDFAECEHYYKLALESATRAHGEIHPDVAVVCSNLGAAYTDFGEWGQAETMHMRALGIREQLYGAMHPDVAESLANLAVVYHSSENFDKARSYYQAAIKTYLAFKKPDAPEILQVQANLESLEASTA